MPTKQETLLGRGARVESRKVSKLGEQLCHVACSLGDSFLGCLWPVILTQSPSWWCTQGSAKMDTGKKDSGRWKDIWRLLLTFPELFWLMVAC